MVENKGQKAYQKVQVGWSVNRDHEQGLVEDHRQTRPQVNARDNLQQFSYVPPTAHPQ